MKIKKFLVAVVLFSAIFYFFFDVGRVLPPGTSMLPTIESGDRYLILKWWGAVGRQDIVIIRDPGMDRLLLKRVVGISGDTLELKKGDVFINGVLTKEPYIKTTAQKGVENFILRGSSAESIVIDKDFVFVMGDNRDNSYDSRNLGPVHQKHIQGKVVCIFWPISRFTIFKIF